LPAVDPHQEPCIIMKNAADDRSVEDRPVHFQSLSYEFDMSLRGGL
jgi:hypothetical protein